MNSTRQEFLSKRWRSYPPAPLAEEGFICGRIRQVEPEQIQLIWQGSILEVPTSTLCHTEDKLLGAAVPADCVTVGDVVALSPDRHHLFLLSPCLQPSPLLFNSTAKDWQQFTEKVADFFKSQGLLEMRTPYLVDSPGVDHHIDFFSAKGATSGQKLYLPTSPEISLKKLLCQGYEQVFEIKHVFRDDLVGPHHFKEFLMLEWYRSYAPLEQLQDDIVGLIQHLTGTTIELKHLTVAACFMEELGFLLTPTTTAEELTQLATSIGISAHPSDDWNDLFFRIFIERIEPYLKNQGAMILSKFPWQQASLSKVDSDGWSQRFEFYWDGIELANAYAEVNDPAINRQRFEEQRELRKTAEREASGWDEDYFGQLLSGMPPCSGIALGLDRLFMVIKGQQELSANAWQQTPKGLF